MVKTYSKTMLKKQAIIWSDKCVNNAVFYPMSCRAKAILLSTILNAVNLRNIF